MSHDMFGEVVRPSVRLGSGAWYTVPLSIVAHVVLAAVVIVAPLMATDVVPKPTNVLKVSVKDEPPPPPPPPVAPAAHAQVSRAQVNRDAAPVQTPDTIEKEIAVPSVPSIGPVVEGGLPAGLVGGTGIEMVPAVVPVPPPPQLPTKPVPVGGHIAVPTKVREVRPVYPSIAQAAKISGTVIIAATIGADGRVKDARIIKSVALLDQAALDAVKQWQFSPTRLNGVPIPVIMTVTVNFSLQ